MKSFKKELSWLLVIALVVSSIFIGIGTVVVSAASQATGQFGSYRLEVKTAAQDCNGTSTVNDLKIVFDYTDGTSFATDTIPGEASPNYFEAGITDNLYFSPAPAKPINSISLNSIGTDRWKIDLANLYYSPDSGSTWLKIATMGVQDFTGVKTFTYPSTYSLNTSSLNKTLTFDANGGIGGTQIYSEYGATLSSDNIPVVTKTGFIFDGWLPAVPSTGPSGDTTYVAQWRISEISVDLNLEVGRYDDETDTFFPLYRGESLATGDTVMVRICPQNNFLAGATRYVVMFSKEYFSVLGLNSNAFTPNTGNTFYSEVASGFSGTTNIPNSAWPATFSSSENYDVYSAVAVGNLADSNSPNGGYPGILTGDWLFSFKLQVTKDISGDTDAHIWMDNRWVRSPSNTTAISYFAKCTAGQYSSFGDSISYNFEVDTSDANILLSLKTGPESGTVAFETYGGSTVDSISGSVGTQIAEPDPPIKSEFVFRGWYYDSALTKAVKWPYTIRVAGATLYAKWVTGINAKSGSTTVIDRTDKFIYGLQTGLTKEGFENNFVYTDSSLRLSYLSAGDILGTGAKVQLIDKLTNDIIETFTIIVFGDVNGDGNIDSIDAGKAVDAENYIFTWDPISDAAYIMAADLNGDNNIDSIDAGKMVDAENYIFVVDQVTGRIS